jgi:hypothetical protein
MDRLQGDNEQQRTLKRVQQQHSLPNRQPPGRLLRRTQFNHPTLVYKNGFLYLLFLLFLIPWSFGFDHEILFVFNSPTVMTLFPLKMYGFAA